MPKKISQSFAKDIFLKNVVVISVNVGHMSTWSPFAGSLATWIERKNTNYIFKFSLNFYDAVKLTDGL